MNAAIEFHDSKVIAVDHVAGAIVVRLAAYVHRSDGKPGYDPGTGWTQAVELRFAGGVVEAHPTGLPCVLYDGLLSGDAEFDGGMPLPTSVSSAVRFEAFGPNDERLVVQGSGVEVVLVAEAMYVEEFPGMDFS